MGTTASSSAQKPLSTCEFDGLCDEISGKSKNTENTNNNTLPTSNKSVETVKKDTVTSESPPYNQGLAVPYQVPNTVEQDLKAQGNRGSDGMKKNEDLYPERYGNKFVPGWFETIFLGERRGNIDRVHCESNVIKVIEKSPLLKLMLSALKSSGCEVDLLRHISCENCSKKVTGGYDANLNQIVVCQNVARNENKVTGCLAHELVHMFDYCRAKLDLKNIDHLACTEIRAANLMHCSFMSAMIDGSASPINIAERHRACVKQKAMLSVLAVRDVSKEAALEAVERVFEKCYNDLEPVGRRLRRNSYDIEKAYRERYHYGYYD